MSYTIKILSRNITTPSQIDSTDVSANVITGMSFFEKLDETLDSGSMTIRGVDRFQPYDLYDTVEVSEGATVRFSMRIAGDSVRLISKSPKKYEHTLTLIEHTKILERYLVSAKTFTQPTDGTVEYTLYDSIDILRKVIPISEGTQVSVTRIFEMPTGSLATFLNGIESPEFTFKDITLREALNQVLGYVEGIPRLERESDGTLRLTVDFINEPNNEILDSSKLLNHSKKQDNDFYATSVVSEAQNLVSENDINEAVEKYPADGSYITPRSDKYIFDYDNSYIYTPKKIYNVNKLEQLAFATSQLSGTTYQFYTYQKKFYYFDTFADFPTTPTIGTGGVLTFFVDMSATNTTYFWNGSSYVVDAGNQADGINPKIRIYETFNDFTYANAFILEPSNSYFVYDVLVDKETGKTYKYDETLTLTENSNFNLNGDLVLDLTDRVFERNVWNTLEEKGTNRTDPDNFYKSNTYTYDYRKNNIQLGTTSGLFDTGVDATFINTIKIFEALSEDGYIPDLVTYGINYFDISSGLVPATDFYNFLLFQVHYTPIPSSQRIEIERQDISEVFYESQITSNQQARTLNLEAFANNLEGRINRIGNSDLELSNKVLTLDSPNYFDIKDYTTDDYIVTNRETIIFKDYCMVKYGLTKNFNMISKFIGVNSEIRQYEMGEQNLLSRVLTTKEFCEIGVGVEGDSGSIDTTYLTTVGAKCLLDTLKTDSLLEPVRGGFIETSGGNKPLIAPFSSNGAGNTLMFFQQQSSNIFNATRSEPDGLGQITKLFERYTDVEGKSITMQFGLFDKIIKNGIEDIGVNETVAVANAIPNMDLTEINNSYFYSPEITIYKDNREELGQVHNLHLVSKDINNIIVGRKFSTRNRMINENPPTGLKLYTYDTEKLNKTNNFIVKEGFDTVATLIPSDIVNDYINNTSAIVHANLTSSKSAWCLTDENDYVLIGANQDGTLLNVITYDFKDLRTGIKYKY